MSLWSLLSLGSLWSLTGGTTGTTGTTGTVHCKEDHEMVWRLLPMAAILAMALSARSAEPEGAAALRLVPFPKEVKLAGGRFALGRPLVLAIDTEDVGTMIGPELARLGLKPPAAVRSLVKAQPPCVLELAPAGELKLRAPGPALREGAGEEDYVLEVGEDFVSIRANARAGLLYGVQTLCQLIRANLRDKGIPCLTIRDWPSLRWRCFQDDLTRGPSSTLDELKREVTLGAFLKMNLFTYYMEHQYAFAKHPVIGPKDGSLLPDELKALVSFGKPLGVDILGNQQSFGHFGHILKHDQYKHLQEVGGVLCPTKEESYKLLDDLYSEVIPLLPFPFFNVCCDETWGLGKGPSKELADKIGVGGVYAGHLRRIHDLLKDKYGKRMMMWGDIILQHPEHLKEIPKDTIMLTWGYDPRASFEHQIVPFAKSGYEFFVCPGVNNWSRILPDFGASVVNIQNFVRDGAKHGALGMLNTSWDDDGENVNAPNWHGFAWGAECAWNASKTDYADFSRRIGAVLFGEKTDHFGQAIDLLAKTHRLPGMGGMHNGRFWQDDLGAMKTSMAVEVANAGRLWELVRPAIEHLKACKKEATANAELLDAFLFGARRMEFMAMRVAHRREMASYYATACEERGDDALWLLEKVEGITLRQRDTYESLGTEFAELWMRENRPYALDWTMGRYKAAVARYDALAKRLAAIRKDAEGGKPLPAPSQVGLGILELGVRKTRADKVIQEPLKPDAPWLDKSATHRLGLVVSAGKSDRADLPVELDIRVPANLPSRRVRVFRTDGEKPAELLAQLDPSDKPGQARLVFLLDSALEKGRQATLHIYLGLPMDEPGPPPPRAALTSPAPKGMKWLENDKVKLLLGPEGAHIYRWEIKALGNRDVTMPGETGWAGFGDVGGEHRSAKNELKCVASGPALVCYVCTDEHGLTRTISLFAGASWAEVTLNSPVGYFWAFDDPKNFAADGPTPGQYIFSNGATGPVGKEADGVSAQVHAGGAHWGVKFLPDKWLLGMLTPEVATTHVVAPGAGAGGVGIERGGGASHFVIYAGALDGKPADLMSRLQRTLDFRTPPEITLYALQAR